jgi:hypothetical protein
MQAVSAADDPTVEAADLVRCTQQFAQNVVEKQKCLSYRAATSRFIAQIASRISAIDQAAATAGNQRQRYLLIL